MGKAGKQEAFLSFIIGVLTFIQKLIARRRSAKLVRLILPTWEEIYTHVTRLTSDLAVFHTRVDA